MNNFKNIFRFLILVLFISCQKESIEINSDSNNIQNLKPNTTLANLVLRVSQNPTSQDNIVDGSSCFSVQLPVTVIVNSQQITVTAQTDYQAVLNAINAFANDDDLVNFVYPISIKFQDFTTKVISNSNQLDDVFDQCDEDDNLDELDCVSINYPITINVYDTNNQVSNTITILNKSQLFNFIKSLSSTTIVAINYPISFVNSNGQTIIINNNSELESAIKASENDCDNDNIGGNGNPSFTTILTTGTWRITYFFDDGDETSNYLGYNFTFNTNGTSNAIKTAINTNGTWSNFIDSGQLKLLLAFDGLTLDEIEEDWQVTEFTATTIKLKHVSGGNGGTDLLTFTKN